MSLIVLKDVPLFVREHYRGWCGVEIVGEVDGG